MAKFNPDALMGVSAIARAWRKSENATRRILDAGEIPSQRDSANRRQAKASDVLAYMQQRKQCA